MENKHSCCYGVEGTPCQSEACSAGFYTYDDWLKIQKEGETRKQENIVGVSVRMRGHYLDVAISIMTIVVFSLAIFGLISLLLGVGFFKLIILSMLISLLVLFILLVVNTII